MTIKFPSIDKLEILTRAELLKRKDKIDQIHGLLIDEFIAQGRGHELPSETLNKTDALSETFKRYEQASRALRWEMERRMRWSGTYKPIKN